MSAADTKHTVRDNPPQRRYEIYDGEQLAGFTTYQLDDRRISFLHTETIAEFQHRGLARQLVDEELADARRRGLAVLPYCPYVARVIARDPERYLDLVPEPERDRFELPRSAPEARDHRGPSD